ncbi:MAG TPA: type VI secretion system membrane subunit TssM [Burkholderiales bacterium]|nr:type VI secretion system membrane subunit TssM [Burkholderiales bacterium]
MRALFGFFRKRWVLTLLGLLALSLVIWIVGPLFAFAEYKPLEPELIRWLLIGFLFAIWIARLAFKAFLSLRANNKLLTSLAKPLQASAPSETERATAEELSELQRRMQEALGILKKMRVKGGLDTRYIYQLPWYVIIGAPGSGKTTALLNSGLRFPLAERLGPQAIRGVGGTRNCDWWFTDEAVLLDTAGRYTTQDSDRDVDKAAWNGFLNLLKRHRGRRPINGVLIAVSLRDLLSQTANERERQAREIRQRLQELTEFLGIRFPVYVLFTKCDLLAGFVEFFGDLDREQRGQVWGITSRTIDEPNLDALLTGLPAQLDALEQRLHRRLLMRVQEERDPRRRALIYSFPQEFSANKAIATSFLTELFQATRFEQRSMLRGIYFTSGTQEGTPIDRAMTSLARAYGLQQSPLPANVASGKSYFINRLLKNVIFAEADLAGTNLRFERHRAWFTRGAYAGLAALAGVMLLSLVVSYGRNQNYIKQVDQQSQQVRSQLQTLAWDQPGFDVVMPILNGLHGVPGGYEQRDQSPPLTMRFGLYQGHKLGEEAQAAYGRALEKILLPRVVQRLEQQLRTGVSAYESQFELLKVYLMLNDPRRFDAPTVQGWVQRDWVERIQEISPEKREMLRQHTNALFENAQLTQAIALDERLVDESRRRLLDASPARRIYERIRQNPESTKLPEFTVVDAAGGEARNSLTRISGQPLTAGIPGLFTYTGYHDYFKTHVDVALAADLKEAWVLGASLTEQSTQSPQVLEEIYRLYFDEYIKRWEALLNDVTVQSMAGVDRAVEVLGRLTRPDTALRKFLEAAANETSLSARKIGSKSLSDMVPKVVGKALERTPIAQGEQTPVDRRFAQLHRALKADDSGKAPIDASLAQLKEVHAIAVALKAQRDAGQTPAPNPADEAVLNRVESDASQQPAPLGPILQATAKDIRSTARGVVIPILNQVWVDDIATFCKRALRGRYPLARSGVIEATQEDFGLFFRPGGKLEAFYQMNLEKYLGPYSAPRDNRNLPISRETLLMFQNAKVIREVFFRSGAQAPALNFDLKPVRMDARINQFILDVDGQIVRYEHGPTVVSRLTWPNPRGGGQVRIQINPPAPSGRSAVSEDGPWALFKMLDKAEIQPANQQDTFLVTFQVEGRTATFELRASSVYNPFRLKALERFECSERL